MSSDILDVKGPYSSVLRQRKSPQSAIESVTGVSNLLLTDEKLTVVHPYPGHLMRVGAKDRCVIG